MRKPRISLVFFWLVAAAAAVLLGFFVALLAGAIPVGDPDPPADTGALVARLSAHGQSV